MLNKKVKGEGLKTLFIYVRVGKGKKGKIKKYPRVKNRKSPKKNIISLLSRLEIIGPEKARI